MTRIATPAMLRALAALRDDPLAVIHPTTLRSLRRHGWASGVFDGRWLVTQSGYDMLKCAPSQAVVPPAIEAPVPGPDWSRQLHKYAQSKAIPIHLDISGPPCSACAHWSPQIKRGHSGLGYEGVRLCDAEAMHRDFSCFKHKG